MTVDLQSGKRAQRRDVDGDSPSDEIAQFERLLAEAKVGSRDAIDQLIRSLQGFLLVVANDELARDVQGKLGASDLVQSALILAEQNLHQFRGETRETFIAWLKTILRNEINAAHRKFLQAGKRNVAREIGTATDSGAVLPFADRHPSPRTEVIADEDAAGLRAAICRLPDDYRRVIVLRNWERLPFDEIGERMQRSTEAVKKLWARAIKRLKKELSDDASPGRP